VAAATFFDDTFVFALLIIDEDPWLAVVVVVEERVDDFLDLSSI
jgi:hypothetical protein